VLVRIGQLEGLAPTGARVSVTGISTDRWKDGKVVEAWTEWDNLGLARQLGAAPPKGSMREKIGLALQRLMALSRTTQGDWSLVRRIRSQVDRPSVAGS
jgi:SnoaL-like polyketide cyclase